MMRFRPALVPSLRPVAPLLVLSVVLLVSSDRGGTAMEQAKPEGLTIRGEVIPDPGGPAFEKAKLNVYLEEVTELDLEAKVVAVLTLHQVSGGGPNGSPLRFAFGEFRPAEDANYNVRAHIDVDINPKVRGLEYVPKISVGDYLSMGRYGALNGKDPQQLRIKAQLVR